jgi:predicted acetyltransferase
VSEGLWLRVIDLESALTGRTYAADDTLVVEVQDELCPWNAGRWRMGTDIGRTDEGAELELDIADFASAYLGAFDFEQLAVAQRVRELKPGALERATNLFRTSRPPYCPEDF